MSHRFYEGEIFHKRFFPKEHSFTYDYFFLDIDVLDLASLSNPPFKHNRLGVMSFLTRDHFGKTNDFLTNVQTLIQTLGWSGYKHLRFLSLPRIFHFVFNPISLVLLLDEHSEPTHCVAEVHNYNGGRVLYPMTLTKEEERWSGEAPKSMYVSPFMGYEGKYRFELLYNPDHFAIKINLHEGERAMLVADFKGSVLPFTTKSVHTLLCNHTFLSLFVVTRTLYQSLRLKLKGLTFYSPRPQDQLKMELS